MYFQVNDCQKILKLMYRPLAFISCNAFFKTAKGGLELEFCIIFEENISHVIFYQMTEFHCLTAYLLLEVLHNMCIVIICFPVYGVMKFEIEHRFLIKP